MFNLIFWKKVQGQKHPGRWGIVEHQIPSVKVLFKTNTKSHKHPGIRPLSSESKTQLVNQRKQKVVFNLGTAHSPEIQSYRMWWGAASPILNDTHVVCIYTSYNRTHIENAYIYILTQSFWTGTKDQRVPVSQDTKRNGWRREILWRFSWLRGASRHGPWTIVIPDIYLRSLQCPWPRHRGQTVCGRLCGLSVCPVCPNITLSVECYVLGCYPHTRFELVPACTKYNMDQLTSPVRPWTLENQKELLEVFPTQKNSNVPGPCGSHHRSGIPLYSRQYPSEISYLLP